jgi:hypothetical protein
MATTQVGLILPPLGRAGKLMTATQSAITGTGSIATGLAAIDVGSTQAAVANSATSATTDIASITSVSAGAVAVAVTLLTFTGPTIAQETNAKNVNVLAVGTVA